MSRFWEKFFFIFSFITQGSSYLSPNAYGILHRMHHAYADTENDPHSPIYDKNLFAMMWRTKVIFTDIFYGNITVDKKFKKDVPEWLSFEKFADKWLVRFTWIAIYVAIYVFFAHAWWVFLFLPINIFMSPLHGVIINWFAHKYGYINFKIKDTSKNFLPVDFLMLGESYHNNHHKLSSRANFGVKWFEIDPVYPIILLFNKLNIIRFKTTSK